VSNETRREFERWLAQSAAHREEFEAIDRVWATLQTAAQDPQILALRHETALRLTCRTSERNRPLRWVTAAAILIALTTILVVLILRQSGDRSLTAWLFEPFHSQNNGIFVTVTGERSAVTLGDGSQVTLDTQSEIRIAFSKEERIVRLTRGQAIFEVAKDPSRPFVVEVNHRRFIALGTAFDVRVDDKQIKVTMIEGTVRVEPSPQNLVAEAGKTSKPRSTANGGPATREGEAGSATIFLTAGEQLTVDANTRDYVRPADSDRITSWRRGQVIFDNTRLTDAVAELNRYSEIKIELADAALADLRLSGAFTTGRLTVFVEAVTTYFPVQVTRSDDRAVVLSARK
jgi:transmembrane sensor